MWVKRGYVTQVIYQAGKIYSELYVPSESIELTRKGPRFPPAFMYLKRIYLQLEPGIGYVRQ